MAKSKHVCPKPKDNEYQWPCRYCEPEYYTRHTSRRWFVLEIVSDLEPQIKGPFKTQFAMEKKARSLREQDPGKENGLFWMFQDFDKRPVVGSWSGGFFEKGEDKHAN